MGLFKFFSKDTSTKSISSYMQNYSINGVNMIFDMCDLDYNENQYLKAVIYLELIFMELHIIDKISSNNYTTEEREQLINQIINELKNNFIKKQFFDSSDDSDALFEEVFVESFYKSYGNLPIVGDRSVVSVFVNRINIPHLMGEDEGIPEIKKILIAKTVYPIFEGFVLKFIKAPVIVKFTRFKSI